ncbi:M15 family metallopeptidase [Algicola sagamiensis]|uniref:M15 family metallopeptidase n=1 Tax=Algicola sagamiensis TaxID=163869 RepID=UPI00036B4B12|nr:M15 family metallopeptidase [Algicola sagamiensis]
MPKFSIRSQERLNTCHPDLQLVFEEVVKVFDCSILCGHRDEQDQNQVFLEGKSQLKFPKSKHNTLPSMAVDVVPYPIDWKNKQRFYYFAGTVMGIAQHLYESGKITHLIRWGGDWDRDTKTDDQTFMDLPHFELIKA